MNQWFRFYWEFINDPKVQMMSEAYQRRLVCLLCIRCSNVTGNGDVTLHDENVAFQLRISNEEWMETKACFIAKHFIDEANNIINWDKRQYASDSSRERVAKHRNKVKQECNVTVTPPDTDTDTDISMNTSYSLSSTEVEDEEDVDDVLKKKQIPYQSIVRLYHENMPNNPRCEILTSKRKGQISARWNSGELDDLDTWARFFKYCAASRFITGQVDPAPGRKRFIADIEWLTNESNYTKIVERKYHG